MAPGLPSPPRTHDDLPLWLVYPLAAILLATGLTLGLATLRSFDDKASLTFRWMAEEVVQHPGTYGFAALFAALVLGAFGFMLGRREERLLLTATTDPLTGLWNRRHLQVRMNDELARAARQHTPLALLIIDVDRLKLLNDEGGHQIGDAALQMVARALRQTCRAMDVAARYAGDEFVVLAPGTGASDAFKLAERIRGIVRAQRPLGPGRRLTVSIGVVDVDRACSLDPGALFAAADRALYIAKEGGRDRTFVAPRASKLITLPTEPALPGMPEQHTLPH